MALTLLGLTFFGFLILGVPVAFAIGLSALCTILYEGLPTAVIFQQMMSGMNIFSFLAIPFFIFAGELMLYGGIAERRADSGADDDADGGRVLPRTPADQPGAGAGGDREPGLRPDGVGLAGVAAGGGRSRA